MTEIEVDGDSARSGVMALVITVIEILLDAMEREAVRRMESDRLDDDEIERLGSQLARLEEEIAQIKVDEGIEDEVDELRGDLDSVVSDAVRSLGVRTDTLDEHADPLDDDGASSERRDGERRRAPERPAGGAREPGPEPRDDDNSDDVR